MDKLNLKTYQIPGLDKPNTNAIFNCGEIICGRINPFFEKDDFWATTHYILYTRAREEGGMKGGEGEPCGEPQGTVAGVSS